MEQPRRVQRRMIPLFHGIYYGGRKLLRNLSKKLKEQAAEEQLSVSIGVLPSSSVSTCAGQRVSS